MNSEDMTLRLTMQRSLRVFGIGIIALLIVLVVETGAAAYPTATDLNIQGSVWRWVPEAIVPVSGVGYSDYYPEYHLDADTGTFLMDTPFNSVSYIERYFDLPSDCSSLSLTVWGARNINGWCGDPVTVTVSLIDSGNITHQLGSFIPVQLDGGVGQGETKKFSISNFAGQKVKIRIKQTSSGEHCTYGYYRDVAVIPASAQWGTPTQLTYNTASDDSPSISANGSKIAFASDVDGDFEIFVINSDGSGLTQLTHNAVLDLYPSISGDGSKIAFASDVDGDFEIFVINSDGSGLTQLTHIAYNNPPSISGDGSKIAFASDAEGYWEIFVVNSDGTDLTKLTHNAGYLDWYPSVSGDGSKIAFESYVDGDWEIFIINSDGTGLTQLTHNAAIDLRPSVSGDGSKITFKSNVVDGDWEIFVINSDGSGLTQLTSTIFVPIGSNPSISGDGRTISFMSYVDGDHEIFVINSDGTGLTQVTHNTASDLSPSISADGSIIVFKSYVDGDWEIFVVSCASSSSPTADAGGPYYGYVNESIQFYGTGTDLDGHIDAHDWDFDGDNITDSTHPNPNHSWSVAGTYYPTLKVQDNDGTWSEPDVCEVHVYEKGEVTVLIVTNFQRMRDISYGDASVDALQNKVIVDLKRNNPQGKCALVDLDRIPAIKSDYDIWAGHEGDITRTNYLVQRIDDYIEEQKRIRFPMLKYVIIVGSHEVIPMKARPDDYYDENRSETQWADTFLPQKSGYLYEIYKNGFYLTDTIYADLSYMDPTKDHELTPELAVGRLVETPEQIIKVIDAYMNNTGEIPKKQFLSIAAYDYKDSASKAEEEMRKSGVPTHYVSACNYSSSLVPFAFNTKNPDVTYLSGHGDYNRIETHHKKDYFMAGDDPTRGDTSEMSNLNGAVIINAGCHNGINLGNKLYHEPDAGTYYSDFPEEFAKKGVVAYIGATGYTRITGTNCSNDINYTGGNEEVATNTIHRLLCGTDIGTAHRDGLMLYYIKASTTSPISHEDRRILAIPTLYGISTYKDPISGNGAISSGTGYSINIVRGTQQSNPEELSITITNYSIDYNSGIVTILGTSQIVSSNEPIIPILFVEKTLPRGSNITNVVWNEKASDNVTVINDIPIPTIGFGEERIKGNFSYDGFYPPMPFANYSILTLGGGGSEVGISVTPVQYNSKTNQTKIWTRMFFDIYYDVPDTGISVVNLSTDKSKYTPKDYVELKASLLNEGSNTSVNLSVLLRNFNTSEEITEIYAGTADLGSGTTSVTSSISLQSIPLNQIAGKGVQCELLVSNPYNLEILASESVAFSVTSRGLCGDVAPCPDCDGTVDMGDVILLLNNVSYPENPRYVLCNDWAGDCGCTGVRDMGDVILLLNNVSYPEASIYALDCCG